MADREYPKPSAPAGFADDTIAASGGQPGSPGDIAHTPSMAKIPPPAKAPDSKPWMDDAD